MAPNSVVIKITAILIILVCQSKCQDEFPENFKFGTATSSYQIEGAWNEDGKSISVWDRITHETPQFVIDQSNGDIACDSYHKIQEDVRILKELGVNSYRFSLAWTRILPGGYTSTVNEKGVEYYNNLINELIQNEIEPIVTLYHWDMPQILSPLGGLANQMWIDYYSRFARIAFEKFGDRVKTWITFNEPNMICHYFNFVLGAAASARRSTYPNGVIEYACTKNLLKAHAEAYHIYAREFRLTQKGKVGITLNCEWAEPASDSPEDIEAAERRLQFDFGMFAHPLVHLDYPQVVKDRVAERSKLLEYPGSRLQLLTFAEQLEIKGTYDFIGLNYYTTWKVRNAAEPSLDQSGFIQDTKVERFQDPSWEETGVDDNKVYPSGLRSLLKWIKDSFNNPEIMITECGYSDKTGVIDDQARINFFRGHLTAVLQAITEDEVNVSGFMAWSLMDNFEWNRGYTVKFGFYDVDFDDDNRPRTPRSSVEYYKNITTTRRIN